MAPIKIKKGNFTLLGPHKSNRESRILFEKTLLYWGPPHKSGFDITGMK